MSDPSLEALIRDYDQRAERFPPHPPYTEEWTRAMNWLGDVGQGVMDCWQRMVPALRIQGTTETEIDSFRECLEMWLTERGDLAMTLLSLARPDRPEQTPEFLAQFHEAVSAMPQRTEDLILRARDFDRRLKFESPRVATGPLETLIHEFKKLADQHARQLPDTDEKRDSFDRMETERSSIIAFWNRVEYDLRLIDVSHAEIRAFELSLNQWLHDYLWVAMNSPIPAESQTTEQEPPVYAQLRAAEASLPQRTADLIRKAQEFDRKLKAKPDELELPPLSQSASAAYEILLGLPVHRALKGPQLLEELEKQGIFIEQSTLTSRVIPELEPYGVENKPKIGYRIRPSRRPAQK